MKIFAILTVKPAADLNDFASFIEQEELLVWKWVKAGLVQQVQSRTDKPGAVIEFAVTDEVQATELLSQLPGVQKELMEFTCIPVQPFDGFEVLFDSRFKSEA